MTEPNLHHLRYLIAAAEHGGLAAAAQKLGVSQPAISQAIRKLEEILDCELLTHSRNRFKLTEEGKLLIEKSKPLLAEMDQIKNSLKGLKLAPEGPLTIATSSAVATFFLPSVLHTLFKEYPKIKPIVKMGSAQEIIQEVRTGRSEIGLLIDDGGLSGLERKLIQKGSFRCIANSKLNTDSSRFLATHESPGVYELQKAHLKHFNTPATIALEVESWEVIAAMAAQGLGVGFVPDFIADQQPGTRILEKHLGWSQKIEYRLFLLHQGHHQLSRQSKIFLETF